MLEKQDKISNDRDSLFDNRIERIEWLSIKDAARLYPIGIGTLYKYKMHGIPVRKLGGKLIIKRSELEEWFERWAA